mmetsp:Transcript_4825/g.10616  ORF Transcript_4825/g.10616 Transcript_4825/m.10616 type:complete len:128 (-) Transcript_4825:44-427(-)
MSLRRSSSVVDLTLIVRSSAFPPGCSILVIAPLLNCLNKVTCTVLTNCGCGLVDVIRLLLAHALPSTQLMSRHLSIGIFLLVNDAYVDWWHEKLLTTDWPQPVLECVPFQWTRLVHERAPRWGDRVR